MEVGSGPWWPLTVLVCAALPSMARGATTWVVGSGVTHLPTIRAAVDVAAQGDTIILSPGTYSGPGNRDVDVQGKAITIQGSLPDDPTVVEQTVIDCAGSLKEPHRAFYIVDCNGVVLSGLTITHGLSSAGGAVYCRSSMLEVLSQDYVRTAHAKGLLPRTVLIQHVFRNGLIPVVTLIGLMIGGLVEGAFITETMFGIPGIGRFSVDSFFARDYPVIMAITLIGGVSYTLANLIVDLSYAFLDPRIRLQ